MKIVTWAMVKPRVDREKEQVLNALADAPLDRVPDLQAQYRALASLSRWFEQGAQDTTIFDVAV